ncbi:DUF4239 domain containing protein [Nitzschia inconspicua]|uniref:DUF4239 domain containing protein n=1 Tax=Nitzschia inconspicua TaxID=303405 RepID=A0A9K3L5R9_9STRA|nr:DUF4239 domain containing protein [Nitzschia inconspicua]
MIARHPCRGVIPWDAVLALAFTLGTSSTIYGWTPKIHERYSTRWALGNPPRSTRRKRATVLCVTPSDSQQQAQMEALSLECRAFMENHEQEQQALLERDSKIYVIPVVVAVLSFTYFVQISEVFHVMVDACSFGRYKGELSDEIRPLINGPVTLTISILFGSLVSMTISTLYERQTQIHRVGIAIVNEARHILYLAEGLPEPERSQVRTHVNIFTIQRLRSFFRGDMFSKEGRRMNLNPVMLILHNVARNQDNDGPYLAELYASMANIKQIWIDFVAATQKQFTPGHYANLLSQAVALLVIYLWETDDATLLEAHTFELRVAFALLMTTMAWIAAIIIDLSTPISNIITMIKKYGLDMDEMIAFGLAKDMDMNYIRATNGIPSFANTTEIQLR